MRLAPARSDKYIEWTVALLIGLGIGSILNQYYLSTVPPTFLYRDSADCPVLHGKVTKACFGERGEHCVVGNGFIMDGVK